MAFGKPVAAEPLDLGKAADGEIGIIATFQHPADKAVTKPADGAHALEGGQRAAQPVGLGRGKAGRDHGDLHRLFLKQRHPIGAAQNLHHGGAQILDLFPALPAVDEGMHHAALDRTGADDGDLADQIVELARLHPGQKVQLRPAFDLKDANRIGAAQHVIDPAVFGRHIGQGQMLVPVVRDQTKGLADRGQHAKGQDIDLEQTKRVYVVLVPFDDGAILHRGVLDGAQLVQAALGDDKAADMLRQMAGKADDLADQLDRQGHAAIFGVQPGIAQPVFARRRRGPAPDLPRQPGHHILTEPHDLAHLADRGAAAEMDHHRRQPRAFAGIAIIDPLDHLFAPFVFEIHVDIGRLAAFLGDEPLEDQGDAFGGHLGDAQQIAHHRIRGRPPPLTQDPARAGELHDVMHGQEIGRIVHLADQAQFLFHARHDP